jgi:hypothetical protein
MKINKIQKEIVYTPKPIALTMIKEYKIKNSSKILDPSKGGDVVYDNLSSNCMKGYCEISKNKVFIIIMIM